MTVRQSKRKAQRIAESVKRNAKKDMIIFLSDLNRIPTDAEVLAWQHGYLAGINRASYQNDSDK